MCSVEMPDTSSAGGASADCCPQAATSSGVHTRASGVFLLDMGVPIRIVDLARRLIALHGYGPDTIGIAFTGARPGEKLHEQLAYDSEATRPTAHPDIHVWEQPAPDPGFIQRTISELSPGRRGTQAKLVAETVRRLVTPPQVTTAA